MAAACRYLISLCSFLLALFRVESLEKTFVVNESYGKDPETVFNETAGISLTLKCKCVSCTELHVLRDENYIAYFRRYNKKTLGNTVPPYDSRVEFFRANDTYTVVISNLTANDTGRYFCRAVAYSEVVQVNVEEPSTEDEGLRSSTAGTEPYILESTAGNTDERNVYQTSSTSFDYIEASVLAESVDEHESTDRLANPTKTSIIEDGGEYSYPFLKSISSMITVLQSQDQTLLASFQPSSTIDLRTGHPHTADASASSKIAHLNHQVKATPSSDLLISSSDFGKGYSKSKNAATSETLQLQHQVLALSTTIPPALSPDFETQYSHTSDATAYSRLVQRQPRDKKSSSDHPSSLPYLGTGDSETLDAASSSQAAHPQTLESSASVYPSLSQDPGSVNSKISGAALSSKTAKSKPYDKTPISSIKPSSSLDLERVSPKMIDAAAFSKTANPDLQVLASSASVNPSSTSEFAPQHSVSPHFSLTSTDSESGSGDGHENFILSSDTFDRQTPSAASNAETVHGVEDKDMDIPLIIESEIPDDSSSKVSFFTSPATPKEPKKTERTKDSKREDSTVLPSSNSRAEDEGDDASVEEEDSDEETNPVTTSTESSLLRYVGVIIPCVIIMLAVITVVVTKLWMKHQEVNL